MVIGKSKGVQICIVYIQSCGGIWSWCMAALHLHFIRNVHNAFFYSRLKKNGYNKYNEKKKI